jgi:hypothetical protein
MMLPIVPLVSTAEQYHSDRLIRDCLRMKEIGQFMRII